LYSSVWTPPGSLALTRPSSRAWATAIDRGPRPP